MSAAAIATSRLLRRPRAGPMLRAYDAARGGKTSLRLRFSSDFPSENCLPRVATRLARSWAESRGIERWRARRDTPCYAVAALLSRGSAGRSPPGAALDALCLSPHDNA